MTVRFSGCLKCSATVRGSCCARRGSISTATTDFAISSIARVSEPRPGPISSAMSSFVTPAVRTIFVQTFESITKFCPSDLDGFKSNCAASSRICAAPSNVMG